MKICDDQGNYLFFLEEPVYNLLMVIRKKINFNDTQKFGIICGKQGSGKSVVAQKFARVISGKPMTLDKIPFDIPEFKNAVNISSKECIIADEGISILFTRNIMTRGGREMTELLNKMRVKNLCVLLCIPNIFNLPKDFIEENSNFTCVVWENEKEGIKGNFAIYPKLNIDHQAKYLFWLQNRRTMPYLTRPKTIFRQKGEKFDPEHPEKVFYNTDRTAYLDKKTGNVPK
jgi:hypothetical protein